MMNGIVKEILALNSAFFEKIGKYDEENIEEYEADKDCISQKLRNKVEAFLDFTYRDYPDVYKKLLDESSCAADEDPNLIEFGFDMLDDYELVENYILLALCEDYEYKGFCFKSIFENSFFEKEEDNSIL